MSKSNNYIPFEIKDKEKIYYDSVSYPIDHNKIKKYSDLILKKAENFIISRANNDFYKRLKIYQVEVNYPKSVKIKNYNDESLFELTNFDITYWIIYTYEKDKFQYAFGLEFDKNGIMISDQKFPDYSKNKDFENFTQPCDALEKIKSSKDFKGEKVDFIELSYLDEINSFCWLVQEKYDVYENQEIEFGKYYNYSESQFYINANTNEYVTEKTIQRSVIYSGAKIKLIEKD